MCDPWCVRLVQWQISIARGELMVASREMLRLSLKVRSGTEIERSMEHKKFAYGYFRNR